MSSQPLNTAESDCFSPDPEIIRDRLEQYDALTGFHTQSAFSSRLDELIRTGVYRRTPMTLALLQLANFYEITTWVGSAEARQLLQALSRLLRKTVPTDSLLCHCRSHEFALLLMEDGSRNYPDIAEAIHRALHLEGAGLVPPQLTLDCEIGIVQVNQDTPDSRVAFARARHAIRKDWQGFQDQLPEFSLDGANQDEALGRQLVRALDEKRLKLTFQGILALHGDNRPRYETRVVMDNGEQPCPAGDFISLAVRQALGERLDRQVLTQAVSALRSQPPAPLQLTVNITQNSLVSPDFCRWLSTGLPANPGGRLILQVSELDILITQHHLERFCAAIGDLQLGLSINHFGATEDPFRYLGLFPAGLVKLHCSRLQQLSASDAQQQNLRNCIDRLHQRGIRVIAAGIENFSDLPLLWSVGVDYIQGHCLHQPSRSPDCEFVEELELSLDKATS